MVGDAQRARSTRPRLRLPGDVAIACLLIILFLPLMIAVAIAIKCDSQGPILLWERRRDPSGRQFWALKFRTVHESSYALSYNGPKTTFVGGIIRGLRIDMLPQLVNVLRGEMTCLPAGPDYLFFLE